MRNQNGKLINDYEELKQVIVGFYEKLFSAQEENDSIDEKVNRLVRRRITNEEIQSLNLPVTEKEIEDTMLRMKKGKAPSPDGFTSKFYRDSWQTVKCSVVEAVQTFFATTQMPKKFNSITISLIPKVSNRENMKDFRPISCCNTVYKCITTILVNRLKQTLSGIIGLQ
ncbi:hypothetical protein LIER_14097 [Lithospermum erythrorhizon]|uniref:Reverse transcriptase domain-containing protein n=1 Tax=Lithospermum erythrorhizon TaxID=34254 RepID=A0AAV3PYV3_LITER